MCCGGGGGGGGSLATSFTFSGSSSSWTLSPAYVHRLSFHRSSLAICTVLGFAEIVLPTGSLYCQQDMSQAAEWMNRQVVSIVSKTCLGLLNG